jgi:hypothetical protein
MIVPVAIERRAYENEVLCLVGERRMGGGQVWA